MTEEGIWVGERLKMAVEGWTFPPSQPSEGASADANAKAQRSKYAPFEVEL